MCVYVCVYVCCVHLCALHALTEATCFGLLRWQRLQTLALNYVRNKRAREQERERERERECVRERVCERESV